MKNITLCFFAILILQSCTTRFKIQSNKSEEFHQKIDEVYVLIKLRKNMPAKYSTALKSSLKEELTLKNIPHEIEILNSLSLGNEFSLTRNKRKEQPVIIIKQEFISSKYDVKLFFPIRNNPIWRANLEMTNAAPSTAKKTMTKASKKIIEKLTEDGFF